MTNGLTGVPRPEGLVVIGEGKISTVPDMAVLTLGIECSGGNAVQALNESSARLVQVAQAFINKGIKQTDLQNAWVNVYPFYGQAGQAQPSALGSAAAPAQAAQFQTAGLGAFTPAPPAGAQTPVPPVGGFLASRGLRVLWRDPARLGELLELTLTTGATSIWGISFTLQDEARVRYAALEAAGKDARAKAEIAAATIGKRLGAATGFAEEHVPFEAALASGAAAGIGAGAGTGRAPAVPGDFSFTARVRVAYEVY